MGQRVSEQPKTVTATDTLGWGQAKTAANVIEARKRRNAEALKAANETFRRQKNQGSPGSGEAGP